MPTPLPDQLHYMESALRNLRAVPAEELNEDLDISELEAVLRERVKDLSIREAQSRIAEDRKALADWLERSGDENGSGAWVVGFLSYRPGTLARSLLGPPEAERPKPSPGPTIVFEPPEGWLVKQDGSASSITLWKEGKQLGGVSCIKSSSLALYRRRFDALTRDVSASERWTKSSVQFGECHGDKYRYTRTSPVLLKNARYVLEVPGGAVEAVHGSDPGGEDFYEALFEDTLHTLRVIPAG
jgi:hypothetical protein